MHLCLEMLVKEKHERYSADLNARMMPFCSMLSKDNNRDRRKRLKTQSKGKGKENHMSNEIQKTV